MHLKTAEAYDPLSLLRLTLKFQANFYCNASAKYLKTLSDDLIVNDGNVLPVFVYKRINRDLIKYFCKTESQISVNCGLQTGTQL